MRILKALHWLDEHLEEVLMVGLLAAIICAILFQVIMRCFSAAQWYGPKSGTVAVLFDPDC